MDAYGLVQQAAFEIEMHLDFMEVFGKADKGGKNMTKTEY